MQQYLCHSLNKNTRMSPMEREREREREREITLRNQLLTVYFSSPISALKYLLYHVRTLFENFLS